MRPLLRRSCVCHGEGRTLCGVCALRAWVGHFPSGYTGRIFNRSASCLLALMRKDAEQVGVSDAARLGSHAWRQGMARDIVHAGGSLATLLRAGQWRSRSFIVYLQEQSLDEDAVARLVIDDSDDD